MFDIQNGVSGEKENEYFRHIPLLEFIRGANIVETAGNICTVYGENGIGGKYCKIFLISFQSEPLLTRVILHVQESHPTLIKIV